MNATLKILIVLIFNCVNNVIGSIDCEKLKYSIKTVTKDYKYVTKEYESEVISPEKDAFSITLERDVPKLCKGMLKIDKKTYHFYGQGRGIKEIEPGTFADQNLNGQLHLSRNFIKIILNGTFKNIGVTHLEMTNNQIETIEKGAIENLPHLSLLYLSNNKIKHFYPNSVLNTPKLLFFDMSSNVLEALDEHHFSFMSKERNVVVGLAANKLTSIHPTVFEGIDVFNLGLENNSLTRIPKEVFSGNKLHYLHIENNRIVHLDDEFFEMDTVALRDVTLKNNNFDEETKGKLVPFMKIIDANKKFDEEHRFRD